MILTIIATLLLSLTASVMMSYISMITPIGPWVELIMVLTASGIVRTMARAYSSSEQATMITSITAAAGIAGIVATASGFVVPTIYFLDETAYAYWFTSPFVALCAMALIVLAAGGWGMILALYSRDWFLRNQRMSFPIGEMVQNVVHMSRQIWSVVSLAMGFVMTLGYGVLQDIVGWIPRVGTVLRRAYTLGYVTIPRLAFPLDLTPMLVAIGFVAGHVLALPLGVGIVTKLAVLEPLHAVWFAHIDYKNAVLAFGSGIIIYSTLMSFSKFPYIVISGYRWLRDTWYEVRNSHNTGLSFTLVLPLCTVSVAAMGVLWGAGFSLISQIYTLLLTAVCVYQIIIIAGRVGLAPFGRFATFLMLPGTLLFAFNATQITAISVFVAIACGVAADTLFGQKAAESDDVDTATVTRYQVCGLVIAALAIGPILWLLFTKVGLGTPQLLAQRAQARAVLLSMYQFDHMLLLCGVAWGAVLHLCGINATLVFSGILFPIEFSLMLICGGLLAYICRNRQEWEPMFSGIFAANSLWIVVRVLVQALT